MTLNEVRAKWDNWFELADDSGSSSAWSAAKEVCTNSSMLDWWGSIIELNRIERLYESAAQRKKTSSGLS